MIDYMKYLVLLLIAVSLSFCSCEKQNTDNSQFIEGVHDANQGAEVQPIPAVKDGYQRFLSFNIRHARGMDEVVDYERIINIIRAFDPDFVALQELDSVNTRTDNVDQIKLLADSLTMYGYFGATIPYRGGKYGIGILSKQKPVKIHHHPLPGDEKRAVLIAEFDDVVVASTHLDYKSEENRITSVNIITQVIQDIGKKALLAGDLNEDKLNGGMFNALLANWTIVSPIKNTFPTQPRPVKCIDFILSYGDKERYEIDAADVVYKLPNIDLPGASDHYPVYIDFK